MTLYLFFFTMYHFFHPLHSLNFIFGKISSKHCATDSSMVCKCVCNSTSGCSGASKGESIPVKFLISPFRAFSYSPFTSRSSHTSIGVFTKTSIKFSSPIICLAIARISCVGLIKLLIVITPLLIRSFDTSAIRRIFSKRSASVNVRLLLIPERILSPSKIWVKYPRSYNALSKCCAMVVFPAPDKPVNQITLER